MEWNTFYFSYSSMVRRRSSWKIFVKNFLTSDETLGTATVNSEEMESGVHDNRSVSLGAGSCEIIFGLFKVSGAPGEYEDKKMKLVNYRFPSLMRIGRANLQRRTLVIFCYSMLLQFMDWELLSSAAAKRKTWPVPQGWFLHHSPHCSTWRTSQSWYFFPVGLVRIRQWTRLVLLHTKPLNWMIILTLWTFGAPRGSR